MAWTPLLLFLLHCTGSFSQPVLTQSPSASASLGASVKLTCTLSSEYSSYIIHWYQQHPDKAPKYVMYLKSDGSHGKGNGIPDRFSGSSSGAHRYLSISNMQPEDEADYICGADYSLWYVFGGGTKLTVLGQPKSTPTITVFPPSSEELKTNQATVVCMINDFYPGSVTVTWKANGVPITQGVQTTNPSKHNNKYMANSFLTLTADQWRSHNHLSCQVTHEGNVVEKSVSPADCF
ncbi:immunoglobulin lambda-1 light chain-like [Peromyscus californicus insignis]|uniref:immunoglobulin lambda-1 light chain-like n=1 Tax=Peromyscus californicus insignis TaxID=564181 RepID=UPI0022A7258E|nr:immunoglobulin lambda-1 light chain-like [Peromyscus californicus insignis]